MPDPKPPEALSKRSKLLWRRLLGEYGFGVHELELLQSALEALDRMAEAKAILDREGIITRDRFGAPRKHPAVSIEEQARIAFVRGMRELALEVPTDVRPPRIRGRYAGRS